MILSANISLDRTKSVGNLPCTEVKLHNITTHSMRKDVLYLTRSALVDTGLCSICSDNFKQQEHRKLNKTRFERLETVSDLPWNNELRISRLLLKRLRKKKKVKS